VESRFERARHRRCGSSRARGLLGAAEARRGGGSHTMSSAARRSMGRSVRLCVFAVCCCSGALVLLRGRWDEAASTAPCCVAGASGSAEHQRTLFRHHR
jgi:hypothetical protein